ncbi:hypothetical protein [Kibdelosporangium phytohabitans]|uniref:hypothetical protein n=1 Tax=Kibdelosporangium phytohabitans TaxID=860235 RepID=UPI0012FA62DF|nr:hypothetical protein [Kibdelosporangium phytohabitans]MBE1467425.1 hypothetical protein [Kibdelosporangium phytohabitans]
MLPTDRLVLIDLENVVGFRPKPRTLRTRITSLLNATEPRHHAVAAYAADDAEDDHTASALAWLGVAPLRVPPGPDAAENALLAHAKRMRAQGCALFTVCSGDRAFTALADDGYARIDVVIWEGQPISSKLEQVANHVRRLPRPNGEMLDAEPTTAPPRYPHPLQQSYRTLADHTIDNLAAGLVIGIGLALGHRFADRLLPVRQSRARDD